MKHRRRLGVILLALIVTFTMSFGCTAFAAENQITLTPAKDTAYMAQVIDQLGGGDGLYKQGLNGFEMYENLGYTFMGWRTTGGAWQNQVIGGYIMDKLKEAGYTMTDEPVEAPYGTKPASDKSAATDADYAWEIQYQNNPETGKNLGNTWDPEFASLDVALVKADGTPVNDAEADQLAGLIGGEFWGFNPTTETYQKYFAKEFGMDYEKDIAPLATTSEKISAMHKVLMASDVEFDKRTTVDDYKYIQRDDYADLNKEAILNKRCRLATNSSFTDPAGTDPSAAVGRDGEFIYVGTVNTRQNTNSQGIPAEDIAGKIILTDSSVSNGFTYARANGGAGVASKYAVEAYLVPKDDQGNMLEPWYDSSRYSGGGSLANTVAATEAGTPIVEWQFSNRQYDSLRALLAKADAINAAAATDEEKVKVTGHQVSIGQVYPMTKTEGKPGKGQAVAIAEVKGSVHPEKRVMICAHVQEPGCNDNATGVSALLGLATAYKKLVDSGKIARPKCTITFMWGDEMNMATYWMDGHVDEKANMIAALDMDMTGEDPEKTGGVMRIEKTPDPSALYGYTLDAVPWYEPDDEIPSLLNPYYDENFKGSWDGKFVRLPDSHTLWGAGNVGNLFKRGWYLNDLYMYATSTVIDRHDPKFEVDVCPYEGGSDHSRFLAQQIPSVLTWHFTDYTYHTSTDTLYMASPRELESVAVTTIATAQVISDACVDNDSALDVLAALKEAALKRADAEKVNAKNHQKYVDAGNSTYEKELANELQVQDAWKAWYDEAFESVATLCDQPSEALTAAITAAAAEADAAFDANKTFAESLLDPNASSTAENKLDEFVASIDVPADAQDQVNAIVELAKVEIAEAKSNAKILAVTTKAIQDIEAAIAANDTKKAQELADAKIAAQDEVLEYLKANQKNVSSSAGMKIVLDSVVAIGTAKTKDDVDAALKAAKAAIDKAVAAKKATDAKIAKAKKAKVSGLKVTSKKLKATAKWKKTAGVTGYQVVYKLKGAKKFKTLASTKSLKAATKKLKKGKKYQFKVRAYTVVAGKKVYGPYSKAVTVKIKK